MSATRTLRKSPTSKQPLPHDLDAERNVLGACLLHSDTVPEVASILKPNDFYSPHHTIIFRALLVAHADRGVTDPIVVTDVLRQIDRLDDAGGFNYLLDLADLVVTAVGVGRHAEIVRDHAQRRHLAVLAQEVAIDVQNGADLDEVRDRLRQAAEAPDDGERNRAESLADVLKTWARLGPLVHVATGLPTLDQLTGGGPPLGVPFVVNGAPNSGKTGLALQFAETAMAHGCVVGIVAADSDADDYTMRILQRRGFSREACERRNQADLAAMDAASAGLPLRVYSVDRTIEAAAQETVSRASCAPAVLVVDSIQTARSAREGSGPRYEAITERMNAIRAIAARHRLLVIVISEMNRGGYRTSNAADRVSDMASSSGSGAIEYAARLGVSLRSVEGEKDLVELRIWKNKYGPDHREKELGIFLRLDRARQEFAEDSGFRPATSDDRAEARAAMKDREAVEDAARLALVIVRTPGITATKCEPVVKLATPGRKLGHARFATARAVLHPALVEVRGKGTAIHLHINGDQIPPDVLNEIPLAMRPSVIAARAPESPLPDPPQGATGSPKAPRRSEAPPRPPMEGGGVSLSAVDKGVPPGTPQAEGASARSDERATA